MTKPCLLIGLQLSQTFAPALEKTVAALRIRQPKAKDAELLEQIFVAEHLAEVQLRNHLVIAQLEGPDSLDGPLRQLVQ